jgi:hypothetical protein
MNIFPFAFSIPITDLGVGDTSTRLGLGRYRVMELNTRK